MFGSSLATHGQQAFCFLERFHFRYSQRFLFSIWETSTSVNRSSASSVNKSSGFAFSSFMQISDRAGTEHTIQIIRIRDHKAHMNNSDHKTQRSFLRQVSDVICLHMHPIVRCCHLRCILMLTVRPNTIVNLSNLSRSGKITTPTTHTPILKKRTIS